MFRKILIPLDGSPLAEQALVHVQQLAPPGSELILVNVIETFRYGLAGMDLPTADILTNVRAAAEDYLQKHQRQLAAQQYAVQTCIVNGDAAQGILDMARSSKADLIVMTTHGRSGVARWTYGSVAERVVRHAEQPVWLVRENARVTPLHEWRRILVPLDGSPAAESVLTLAQNLAQQTRVELVLLRVVPELDETNRRILFENETAAQAAFEQWQHNARHYLATVAQRLTTAGIAHRALVACGEPAHTILDTAHAEDVDFIVMATQARRGFDRLLHGSVMAEVLRGVDRPLLLVRAHESPVRAKAVDRSFALHHMM